VMPSVASQHERHAGHVVGSGQCVDYVRQVTGLPPTSHWRRGDPVQGADLVPGTAIATFDARGRYPNSMSGDSHAAILRAAHEDGSITVWDAWLGQPVHERVIRNRQGRGDAVNDSSRYYCIELAEDGDG
jgi:hypothetical protein